MATTVFSGQRTSMRTSLEGTTVKLEGTVEFDSTAVTSVNGTIYKKEGNEFAGNYGMTSVSMSDKNNMMLMLESTQLLIQLLGDCETKRKEVYSIE